MNSCSYIKFPRRLSTFSSMFPLFFRNKAATRRKQLSRASSCSSSRGHQIQFLNDVHIFFLLIFICYPHVFTWYNVYIITSATSAKSHKCVYKDSIYIVTRTIFTLLQMPVTYSALGRSVFSIQLLKKMFYSVFG